MSDKPSRGRIPALVLALLLVSASLVPSAADAAVQELSDTTVLGAVEDELIVDPAIVLNNIDVAVNRGVVSLSGSVDNVLAKERATRIAETVKGVRSVVNRIEVEPVLLRSDTEIERDVQDALLDNAATEAFEVRVSVLDGEVTLRGTVESWREKQLAGTVAKGVRGVKGLENNIDVVPVPDRPDEEILADVQNALRWDALVDHAMIEAAVEDGLVVLSGVVGSAAEKRRAMLDAHVGGVVSVEASDLEVRYWAREEKLRKDKYAAVSDREVREAVEDALLYDPRVVSLAVTTRVDDGMVTLRGTVSNLKAKRAAERDAVNTVGVTGVRNRLKVRPEEPVGDERLERRAAAAVTRDPYLETHEITVNVSGGTARLYGSVDSFFEKARAEDAVSAVEGVRIVDNKVTVDYDRDYPPYDPYVDEQYLSGLDWYRPEPLYPAKGDAEIEEAVRNELWWSPFVDAEEVDVSVDEGTAVLTGKVDSWPEYTAAARNAYEAGAVWVDNDLRVERAK